MSTRLAQGGRLIDRSTRVEFQFNGKRLWGHKGDTLASALLANDQMLMGRSFKYHRPRSVVASGAEEPNALVALGQGNQMEPNSRATTTELFQGLSARSQNHWPSLEFDIGALNNKVARLLPAGFYYKTFIHPRPFWKHVFEPIIRHSAGLGPAPKDRDPDTYEHFYAFADLVIIGGGVAGLHAARVAAEAGQRVIVMEQTGSWGGRSPVDGGVIDGQPVQDWVNSTVQALENMENVSLRLRCMGAGIYDHGYMIGYERLSDHAPQAGAPRHRLWKVRAGQILSAAGALERPLSFAGNDIPGVMLASALRDYVTNFGVSAGDRTVLVTNNDDAYRTALALHQIGLTVPVVIDARPEANGELPNKVKALGIRVEAGKAIAKVMGGKRVTGVTLCSQAGEGAVLEEIACDAVAMSGGWSPIVHFWSHTGGKLKWDADQVMFRPDESRTPIDDNGQQNQKVAGSANGALTLDAVVKDADEAVRAVLKSAKVKLPSTKMPKVDPVVEAALMPVWTMPQGAGAELRAKMWLDFQNDVKVSDVQLAAQEGYESVEHTKRYTTLGMATDQGKLSNINGLAILAQAVGEDIPNVGTTTFRPPYTPISLGSITGEAKGDLFQPIRRTPMHDWHEAQGAYWEPVGQWRRPYCYPRNGESHDDAVVREVKNTRQAIGLLDASTLGKLIVKGPDAGKFLDLIYTNMMSTLKIGRCRYGLMCSENGFLVDDGVVARLDEQTWLCHTTSGGADRIHAHMEEWLQTEWWDLKVHIANLTEHYAQVAIVGPKARELLEKIGGMDVSKDALGFMDWAEGTLGGIPARVFRISFSGELSYEIAVPASRALEFWTLLHKQGEALGAMPYGTEALHIMRAEKGFIMIGDETDGTIIPQDLGLDWAISKKKQDFIGKRAQERSHMIDASRWKLVGLETLEPTEVLPDGALATASGVNANGQGNTQGRVTSSYFSPTLNRGIAMGLVLNGPSRMGEVLDFPTLTGGRIQARIVDPVFYDKDGVKQNV